ncbi:MAG TPA: GTP-binding protein [Burkholderiales bacterium]|nr:GTP-binding protein [Burkholderiales bacterium]
MRVAEDRELAGVLRFITCGSVDDGKSTLIGRLLHDTRQILEDQLAAVASASARRGLAAPDLSLLTDGLEAEREQGITIDVAYRYFATARRKFIIADTPGHEQYTRNMATGASTADAAVVLADATRGLLPQGRRHLYLAHLLGIRNLVVAVNKMDLVGYAEARFEEVREAFTAYARRLGIRRLEFVPVSALEGGMVAGRGESMPWYPGQTLLEYLESCPAAESGAAGPLRLPVQLVQRVAGARRYLGRLASGALGRGDEVLVLPAARRTRVARLFGPEGECAGAKAGESVALEFADEIDVSRGDLVVHAARAPQAQRSLRATLVWFADRPLSRGARYLLKHGTRTVPARVASVEHAIDLRALAPAAAPAGLAMNDIGAVRLELAQPLHADAYAENRAAGAFILIDPASHHTVAAGMVR